LARCAVSRGVRGWVVELMGVCGRGGGSVGGWCWEKLIVGGTSGGRAGRRGVGWTFYRGWLRPGVVVQVGGPARLAVTWGDGRDKAVCRCMRRCGRGWGGWGWRRLAAG